MDCTYHQQQICKSCSWLHLGYQQTLADKTTALRELFPEAEVRPFMGVESAKGSRIRARLAVTGTVDDLQIGFYDDQHKIVPVDQCPLHHPLINEFATRLPKIIQTAKLTPFDMTTDRGELKFVVITCSPTHQQLMVQFVLRSKEAVDRIRSLWRKMSDVDKQMTPVMSINLQPVRSSSISGTEELLVSEQTVLPIRFGDTELVFGPQSFLQTNYEVASALYAEVGRVLKEQASENVLDLYCGAGAFSLTSASPSQSVLGIDVSANAIECAIEAARRNGRSNATFLCRSLECTTASHLETSNFDTFICNPPRRGLDAASVALIMALRPASVVYSSCNPMTLQRDTKLLASNYQIAHLQLFDMFPFTPHAEVLAVLKRSV